MLFIFLLSSVKLQMSSVIQALSLFFLHFQMITSTVSIRAFCKTIQPLDTITLNLSYLFRTSTRKFSFKVIFQYFLMLLFFSVFFTSTFILVTTGTWLHPPSQSAPGPILTLVTLHYGSSQGKNDKNGEKQVISGLV